MSEETQPATVVNEAIPGLARIPDEDLRTIASFEDAIRLGAELHGEVVNLAEELGTGFSIVEKSTLVGEKLVLIEWRFLDGDYGDDGYVFITAVTGKNEKVLITDGSTGIRDQLREYTARTSRFGGAFIPRGLRESQYDICGDCGSPRTTNEPACTRCGSNTEKRSKGSTFYLDTTE